MLDDYLKDYDEEQFIPGIYNYCDRWCERCKMTRHCFLYHQESNRRVEHIKRGEDPDDMDIVIQDVQKSFQDAIEMLEEIAQERGIDLDSIDVESVSPPDLSEHPLHIKAREYTDAAHDFLEKLRNIINQEVEEINTDRVTRLLKGAETIDEIKECYEVISWYHIFISAKIYRALSSKMEAETEEDEELAGYSWDDANGSAKVVREALVKSMNALTKVYEWNELLHNDVMPLLSNIYGLIKGVDREFPEHEEFKRPGLDD